MSEITAKIIIEQQKMIETQLHLIEELGKAITAIGDTVKMHTQMIDSLQGMILKIVDKMAELHREQIH